MGQVRNQVCEQIDRDLREMFGNDFEIECRQDTYTQDYILWISAHGSVQPLRITREEYLEDDWKANVRTALEQIGEN